MEKEIEKFRGLKTVTMVDVCEGYGDTLSPSRIVHYIYDGDELVGKIDPLSELLNAPH